MSAHVLQRGIRAALLSGEAAAAYTLRPSLPITGGFGTTAFAAGRQQPRAHGAPANVWTRQMSVASGALSPPPGGPFSVLRDYMGMYSKLSKARLSALVVSTAAAGFVLGSGETIDWAKLGWTSLGTMGAAASANAFNQISEIKLDASMRRTLSRPLPSGRMTVGHAVAFAVAVGAAGVGVLYTQCSPLTAALGGANLVLYAAVYTPLKQVHAINTWVGAVVGAVPPLLGWAAAAGGLQPGAAVLALGLYWWQLPHFMALAWMCKADYAAGGYHMLSVLDTTGKRTAACALRNSLYLIPLGAVAAHVGVTGASFAAIAAALSAGLSAVAAAFYVAPSASSARLLFRASLVHLPLLMAGALWDRRPNPAAGPVPTPTRWSLAASAPFPFLPAPAAGAGQFCPSRLEAEPTAGTPAPPAPAARYALEPGQPRPKAAPERGGKP